MAEKIKKFFSRKKTDAKFKMAGPGHKLTDDTSKKQTAGNQNKTVPRQQMSEESKLAAQAALLRIQGQRRENPSFNTSLSAIQAQVKRELEMEKKTDAVPERIVESTPQVVSLEASPHLAVSGVFFGCPMISDEILAKDEWKANIKTFLYEQLAEEQGLTACLIIQSCNNGRDKIDNCVDTLCKYLNNIISHPEEEKYHKIRMSNRIYCDKVQPIEGSKELLHAAGFREQMIPNSENGNEENFLVFNAENVESIDSLSLLIDALGSAEPIHLELDRNLQVLLPSQAARRVDLPNAFYSITPAEIKREHQLRAETAEKSQVLRTKAMRDKDELRELRKYKFALIRVRFPDGIFLQGTFSVYDKYSEIQSFVRDNLEHEGLPFVLNSPTGTKINEEDFDKTLVDLRLVPATILTFAWDQSILDEVKKSAQKDVYLKPEIMVLVQQA